MAALAVLTALIVWVAVTAVLANPAVVSPGSISLHTSSVDINKPVAAELLPAVELVEGAPAHALGCPHRVTGQERTDIVEMMTRPPIHKAEESSYV
ncbi:hypothetical protein BDB01DRAFT_786907 [Pilobolus umbonatus]|nr:hypothetical protein BDB01DRAFT_786907 [Pilobolus umbonatus]